MADGGLRGRVADHFSGGSERAAVWRAIDRLRDADAYLNLGYSEGYRPHVLGSSGRRLATQVGRRLARRLPATDGLRLLDLGCGRGGPAVHLADRFGFRVTGVDLVAHNLDHARTNAARAGVDAAFVRADAIRLPFPDGSFPACVAIDSPVYLPDRAAAFGAVADALEPGGVFVCTDLVRRPGLDAAARRRVTRFAEAWDLAVPATAAAHERALADAGLRVRERTDLTPHSVGRFRKWTALLDRLTTGPTGRLLDRALRRWGVDPDTVAEQVTRVHEALPHLRHVLLVGWKPDDG